MSASVKFDSAEKIIVRLGLRPGGDIHKYFMLRAAARMQPYLPARSEIGSVINAQKQGIDLEKGKIIYRLPYAKYLFYGKVMAGTPRKATSKDLVYTKSPHPKAGPFWNKRMMENEESDLAKEVTAYAKGRK